MQDKLKTRQYVCDNLKLKITIEGRKKGSSHGEPRFGPMTKEAKIIDAKTGEEKVLDAETYPGMKSQVTWFCKERVPKTLDSGHEYMADAMLGNLEFDEAYKALKQVVKEEFMERAPEADRPLHNWFEDKEDVDFEVTGELDFNSTSLVEVSRQKGLDGDGYTIEVGE